MLCAPEGIFSCSLAIKTTCSHCLFSYAFNAYRLTGVAKLRGSRNMTRMCKKLQEVHSITVIGYGFTIVNLLDSFTIQSHGIRYIY